MHLYRLNDPHPEAGFRTFFGKLWYEGQAGPSFDWQSTGGSDDFEPKLIHTVRGVGYILKSPRDGSPEP